VNYIPSLKVEIHNQKQFIIINNIFNNKKYESKAFKILLLFLQILMICNIPIIAINTDNPRTERNKKTVLKPSLNMVSANKIKDVKV
jgi:hypothetical protein